MLKRVVGVGGVVMGLLLTSCGASPQIKATPHYRDGALERGRVLFLPLAVSQALGDQRTGIILSDETRAIASEGPCPATRENRGIVLDAELVETED